MIPPPLQASSPFRRALRRSAGRRGEAKGFTLLELVFYAATSSLILMAAATAILSIIRSNTNLEVNQRVEARRSRVSALIQSETTESEKILFGQTISCPGVKSNSTFTLQIPYLPNPTNSSTSQALIHYYTAGSGATAELRRCGPPYNSDGSLMFSEFPTDASISLRTQLVINSDLEKSNQSQITYTLTFYGPDNKKVPPDPPPPATPPAPIPIPASVGVEPLDPGSP